MGHDNLIFLSAAHDSVSSVVGLRVSPSRRRPDTRHDENGKTGAFEGNGWRTASEAEVVAFANAFQDPVRRAVLKLLDLWPMRQFELTKIISEATGRRCRDSLIHYHLRELERAGLIGFGTTRNEHRAKVVYRKVGYRLQFMPRAEPEQLERYTYKQVVGELRRELRKEEKR